MAVASFIGAIGYLYAIPLAVKFMTLICLLPRLLLTVPDNVHVRYFATFCVTSGTYTTIGLTIAWCMSFTLVFVPKHC